ncbi:HesB/YadR/YfhF family protein [Limosilactobacillus pontis]|uniref:HesB/YadR/YfhF family protein n=1 Tax=Limosilactobacillus pontis TaxID=35787 RepID=UPI001DA73A03|nr:Fe-S cluster assembly protein HesB [Limosilactobacillus pontis]HJE26386.1 Fe-S cluster assembly protein HesB [Limosilactobacillus pontis]
MKLIITTAASQWFQQHLNLTRGQGVKLFGKTVQPHHVAHTPDQGFAVEDDLADAVLTTSRDGINYHINFTDEWFFSGLVTTIDYQSGTDQPRFTFAKEQPTMTTTPTSDSPTQATDASTAASQKFEDYWE